MRRHMTPGAVLGWAMRALAVLGSNWICTPLSPPWPPTDQYPAGPPPLHPERLCPGVPLSATESRLQQQLTRNQWWRRARTPPKR
ncbi:DUF6059 family protein [Kitasatospora sp. NPDC001660]